MSLAKVAPHLVLSQDVSALQAEMRSDGGITALAWGILALRPFTSQSFKAEQEQLTSAQAANGGWEENPYPTAIAWMALQTGLP